MELTSGAFRRHQRPPREPPAGEWRFGGAAEVDWIREATPAGLTITSAVPPVFPAYATVVEPDRVQKVQVLLEVLREQSGDQPWWLGYLDTGADDIVFPEGPRTRLYSGWEYVVVQAGPDEAMAWRQDSWSRLGPDLVFPEDRSWLISRLWDDDWRCLGGPVELINRFLALPGFEVRQVRLGEDATPPGHTAI